MRHASLFSGIGGFDLAAEWMGWTNVFNCEIDPFCQKVLKYHFPDALQFGDIKKLKFKRDDRGIIWVRRDGIVANTNGNGCQRGDCEYEVNTGERGVDAFDDVKPNGSNEPQEEEEWLEVGTVDIISGGFPCQPFSMAGKRRGTEDDRHLWPEMYRIIQEIKPTWVVGENVYGFVNWDGGVVFHEVVSDLENAGYEVQPYIIPACAVNAPHRRDRCWVVAHRSTGIERPEVGRGFIEETFNGTSGYGCCGTPPNAQDLRDRRERGAMGETQTEPECQNDGAISDRCGEDGSAADTDMQRYEECQPATESGEQGRLDSETYCQRVPTWSNFPTQPPLRRKYDGFSEIMDRNWNIIQKYYATINEICGNKDLRNLREAVQSEAFWESFGGLQEIFEPEVLLKVLQSLERATEITEGIQSDGTSEIFEKVVRNLPKYIQSSDSSHRRKLEEQLGEQYSDLMCIMPHEIALAVMEIQAQYQAFYSKLRNESIKAYGNAVVPVLVYEIFKAIQEYEKLSR